MTHAVRAEGETPDWRSPPSVGSGPFAIAGPCARVPGRYAEPRNVKNLVAHPWSWAIGSSTSAAQRSFDMVVCRRKARPFVLITKLGLQENGRPSPEGNGAVARVLFDGLRNHGQRVFVKGASDVKSIEHFSICPARDQAERINVRSGCSHGSERRFGVHGRDVQPTLEPAEPWCRAVQAAGSLNSGLALAPGPDPESASSFP